MIQIRRNVFETNSSSTHCLTLFKDRLNDDIDESIFLKKYNIFAGYSKPVGKMDAEIFDTVQNKLTYLVKIILMCANELDYENYDSVPRKLLDLLIEIFPNTDFSEVNSDNYKYYYEDGEYLLDSYFGEAPITKFLDKDALKRFFQYGVAYFGNRDDEFFSNFIHDFIRRMEETHIIAKCSG